MSNLVALEWDAREARVCIGRTRGAGAAVEQAFAIPLVEANEESETPSVTEQILDALRSRGVAKADALVAIGRSSIELRQMQMPPCPDEELADLVRFQAMRQFTGITESWPLDFVPLSRLDDDDSVHVLAAAINPSVIEPIQEVCKGADVSLRKLVLRPFAAASLMKRAANDNQCRMLVDMLADEADLTVLVGDDVVFVRTVRLPATNDTAVRANALLGEIRRTIPAARNQAGGREVEMLTLCGDHAELGPLEEIVKSKLNLSVDYLDPFNSVTNAGDIASQHPENPGRYASLLGAMNAYGGQSTAGIDFINPRRRPKPKSKRGRYAFVAAVAAIVVGVIGFIAWYELYRLGGDLDRVTAEVDQAEKQTKMMRERTENAIAIKNHLDEKDIDWLQELKEISDRLPDPDLALISNLTMSPNPKGKGGKVSLKGFVDDSTTIDELRRNMDAGERRRVDAGPILADRQYDQYRFRITEALYVQPNADPETPPVVDGPEPGEAASEDASQEKPSEEGSGEKPGENAKPADQESSEDKTAEDKSAEDKSAEDKSAEEKPEEKPADKPADDKPAEEKAAEEKAAEEKPADEKPAEDKPAEEQSAEEKPAVEKPAEEKKPTDEKKPAKPKPAGDLTQGPTSGSLKTASSQPKRGL